MKRYAFTLSSCCWQQPQQVFPVYLIQGGHHLASEYGMCRDSRTETKQLENAEIKSPHNAEWLVQSHPLGNNRCDL